jgi:hypothetical protein
MSDLIPARGLPRIIPGNHWADRLFQLQYRFSVLRDSEYSRDRSVAFSDARARYQSAFRRVHYRMRGNVRHGHRDHVPGW